MGEWCGCPKWQSPRGGRMGSKINNNNKKKAALHKFYITELHKRKFNKQMQFF
jgi:hypothetical protein